MLFYSTNKSSPKVNFRDATVLGQAPDGGLYFPETIPSLRKGLIENIKQLSREEIAFDVIKPFTGDTIPADKLFEIIGDTINFEIPLVKITDNIFSLELFHGPTQAFKDIGARFMSRCLGYFVENISKKLTVLVATSGDTGGAVAHGFYDVDGIDVVILYPSGKVSQVQELQLTSLGKNIRAIEINGSFDDCQRMVKQAFADEDLTKKLFLTSANSINVARWLPQQFYYFFACRQWLYGEPPVFSVPSGNFGNVCAGILAWKSGLPVKKFIAACNSNKVVPEFLKTGEYRPAQAIATISNAMDVGDPSNFIRILEIFRNATPGIKEMLESYSVTDAETGHALRLMHAKYGYTPDPHGAVALASLVKYQESQQHDRGIFLETAHPSKFYDTVKQITGDDIQLPDAVKRLLNSEKHSISMNADYKYLKEYLFAGT